MNKHKKRAKIIKKIFILGTIGLIYATGVFFFSDRFTYGTVINGTKYSFKTPTYVANNISNRTRNYTLKIKGNNTYDEVTSSEFDYGESYIEGSILNLKNKQNPFLWPINPFLNKKYNLKTNITYDEYKFKNLYSGLELADDTKVRDSKSATLEFDDKGRLIEEKEVYGNRVDKNKLEKAILNAFHNDIDEINVKNLYIKPKYTIKSKEFASLKRSFNKLKGKKLYLIVGKHQDEINYKYLKKWIKSDENGEISGNSKEIKKYVTEVSYKYDTYNKSREFVTTSGETVSVPNGNYGMRTDINKTVEVIKDMIKKGKEKAEVAYLNKTLNGADDIGDTYIEVSLRDQMLYAYKNGEMVMSTPVVTGNPNTGGQTPRGVYKIWSKEKNRRLVGEDYSSPVKYWMPCTYTGVGLHDASWQSSFGGNRYLYAGSHGCVNMPLSKVRYVFNNFENNTPVIIY